MSVDVNPQSSFSIGYNNKNSSYKYDAKVYVDGITIKNLEEAANEAKRIIAKKILEE